MTDWRAPKVRGDDPFPENYTKLERKIGYVLAWMALPSYTNEVLSGDELDRVTAPGSARSLSIAIPTLIQLQPAWLDAGSAFIREQLVGADEVAARSAMEAIVEWDRLAQGGNVSSLPTDLVSEVALSVQSRRQSTLHSALAAAKTLVTHRRFQPIDFQRIGHGLAYLLAELSYDHPKAGDVVQLSLARVGAAQLSQALAASGAEIASAGKWLEEAATDPLPEVRHSLSLTRAEA